MYEILNQEYQKSAASKAKSKKRYSRKEQYEHGPERKSSFNRRWPKTPKAIRDQLAEEFTPRNSLEFSLSGTYTPSIDSEGNKYYIYIKTIPGGLEREKEIIQENGNFQQWEVQNLSTIRKPFSVTTAIGVKVPEFNTCHVCKRVFRIVRREDQSNIYGNKCFCQMNEFELDSHWQKRREMQNKRDYRNTQYYALKKVRKVSFLETQRLTKLRMSQPEIKVDEDFDLTDFGKEIFRL